MKSAVILALVAAATLASTLVPAHAGDIQGDAYDCKELWVLRNEIYKNNGYCFTSARAISTFGNAGCGYDNMTEVPLSQMDRVIIRDAKKSEARQGC